MAPRVLVSDELSETAVQIFRDRGIDVDFQPHLGKDKDKLAEIIGNYDGLAIRSATKATEKLIAAATNLKVIGRAGIGVDNVDIPAATAKGIIVMNTPFGNSITTAEHAIALMFASPARSRRPMPRRRPASGKRTASWVSRSPARRSASSVAAISAAIVADRAIGLRMHVLAFDPFLSPERAEDIGVDQGRTRRAAGQAPTSSRCTRR
jgi:D-3-phosphoglycerate dehydrogenase